MRIADALEKALQSPSELDDRDVAALPVAPASSSFSSGEGIDEVNLNVDSGAGVTMTFVETVDGEEE